MESFSTKDFTFDGHNFVLKGKVLAQNTFSISELLGVTIYLGSRSRRPLASGIAGFSIIALIVYLLAASNLDTQHLLGSQLSSSAKGIGRLIVSVLLSFFIGYLFIFDIIPIHYMMELRTGAENHRFELIDLEKSNQLKPFIAELKRTLRSDRLEVRIKV
jgi:uncharacterized integral membrane protein